MAKTLCKVLGLVLLVVGLAGFAAPTLLGFHLTPVHNLIHIVSGAIAAYLGFAGSYDGARTFCLVFGVIYLLVGVIGFAAPDTLAGILGHPTPVNLMPDNVLHVFLGVVFLAVGATRPVTVAA